MQDQQIQRTEFILKCALITCFLKTKYLQSNHIFFSCKPGSCCISWIFIPNCTDESMLPHQKHSSSLWLHLNWEKKMCRLDWAYLFIYFKVIIQIHSTILSCSWLELSHNFSLNYYLNWGQWQHPGTYFLQYLILSSLYIFKLPQKTSTCLSIAEQTMPMPTSGAELAWVENMSVLLRELLTA